MPGVQITPSLQLYTQWSSGLNALLATLLSSQQTCKPAACNIGWLPQAVEANFSCFLFQFGVPILQLLNLSYTSKSRQRAAASHLKHCISRLQGDTEDALGNVIMQYDLEPLPPDLTNEQRFFAGEHMMHSFCYLYSSCDTCHVASCTAMCVAVS